MYKLHERAKHLDQGKEWRLVGEDCELLYSTRLGGEFQNVSRNFHSLVFIVEASYY